MHTSDSLQDNEIFSSSPPVHNVKRSERRKFSFIGKKAIEDHFIQCKSI